MKKITFYADDRIVEILASLGQKENAGQFLRTAIHFYMDNREDIKNIKMSLLSIEKKISQATILKSERTDHAEQGKRTYDRSKAIDRILNMGKNTNQEGNT